MTAPPKRIVQREHAFQGVVNRFLDRVVTPPMWTTGVSHENELTDNARARARGRGVKSGVHDIYVAQYGSRSVWIELKWGKNTPSDAQLAVNASLQACGVAAEFAWSIHDVLAILRHELFDLHPNAGNLATEYQARAEAAVRAAEERAAQPYKPSKSRVRISVAQVRRGNRQNAARLGLT